MIRSAVLSVLLVFVAVPAARAQEFHHNAYGVYLGPTIYGIAKGSDYQFATSGAQPDFGLYYAHAFAPSFSIRLEAKLEWRVLDDIEWNDDIGTYLQFRLSESIVEVPLVLQGDRRIAVGEHELRISVGGGASFKYVWDQKLLTPAGAHPLLTAADSYEKLALVLDGGATFAIDRKSSVFARLRYDFDVTTFGEPTGADVIRQFWGMGFYAGFEFGL